MRKQGTPSRVRRLSLVAVVAIAFVAPACDHGSVVGSCLGLSDYTNCKGGALQVDVPCGGGGGAVGAGGDRHSGGASAGGGGGDSGCVPGKDYACYTGPKPTRGVGDCHDGKAKCLANGMNYGVCVGDRTPSIEDPTKEGDEDCDGSPSSDTLWAENFGDNSGQHDKGIAVDPEGNVVIGGSLSGGMKVGSTTLVGTPTSNNFVAKFDAKGEPLWAKQLPAAISIYAVACDSAGAILIAGGWSASNGPVNLGTATGSGPMFIAKLSSQGVPLWSRGCGAATMTGASLAIGPSDEIVLGGIFTGTADCGSGAFAETAAGGTAGYVVRFDADGNAVWASSFAAQKPNEFSAVLGAAVDPTGTIWLTGYFHGSAKIGSQTLLTPGNAGDALLAHFSSDGSVLFAGQIGDIGSADQAGIAIALDENAAPLVALANQGSMDFFDGKPPLVSAGGYDIVLAKLTGSGGRAWTKQFGDANDQFPVALAYDAQQNIFLLGLVGADASVDFGGGSIDANHEGTSVLAKFAKDGSFIWNKAYGDPPAPPTLSDGYFVQFAGIGIAPTNDIFLGGDLHGSVNFGPGQVLTSADSTPGNSNYDVLLLKVAR